MTLITLLGTTFDRDISPADRACYEELWLVKDGLGKHKDIFSVW